MAVFVRAPPPLAPFVERLGYYAEGFADGWEPMPPTGTDHLLVNLASGEFHWRAGADPAIACARGAVVVPGSEGGVRVNLGQWRSAVFVCFHPGGAYPFLGMPPAAAGRPVLDLQAVGARWPGTARPAGRCTHGRRRAADRGRRTAGACGAAAAARPGGGGRGGGPWTVAFRWRGWLPGSG